MTAPPQAVFVRQFGTGPRPVLALHCTIAHSGAWRGLAGALEGGATLTTPDMLSHGRSPDWDRQGDYQDRSVAAVAHLLDPGMDLIGHSFGATIALRLATEYPDKVRSLTMIEPVFFAVALQDAPEAQADHDRVAAGFSAAMATGDEALAARLFNRMWSTEAAPRWPDLPEQTRAAMIRAIHVIPACHTSLYDDAPGLLAPGVLDRITCPSLLLRGSLTHPVIGVVNEGLAARLPAAVSQVIPGAGHMLPISHPAETAASIRSLFDRS